VSNENSEDSPDNEFSMNTPDPEGVQRLMQQGAALSHRSPKRWVKAFLRHLARCGNVTVASAKAGIHRGTVCRRLKADPAFAEAFAQADEAYTDALEAEADRRALGYPEPLHYKGRISGSWVKDGKPCEPGVEGSQFIPETITRYSDRLLVARLAARRPEKYGGKASQPAQTAPQIAVQINCSPAEQAAHKIALADSMQAIIDRLRTEGQAVLAGTSPPTLPALPSPNPRIENGNGKA
jgi:hypothetical protein